MTDNDVPVLEIHKTEAVLEIEKKELQLEIHSVGVQGVQGEQGEQGVPGEDAEGDLNYTETFITQSTVVVNHNLGKYPSIVVFDSANDEVEGQVTHNSLNQLTVVFSSSFSGRIVCN